MVYFGSQGAHPFPFATPTPKVLMWRCLQTLDKKLTHWNRMKGRLQEKTPIFPLFRMCFAILRSFFISKLRLGFGSQPAESQPLNRSSTMRGSSRKDYSVYDFNAEDEAVESSSRRLAKKFGRLRNPRSSRNPPVTKFTFLKTCKISYIS